MSVRGGGQAGHGGGTGEQREAGCSQQKRCSGPLSQGGWSGHALEGPCGLMYSGILWSILGLKHLIHHSMLLI